MNARYRGWAWGLAALAMLAGCSPAPAPPADTGAEEAVLRYFEALLRQDWPTAYAALDANGQARWGAPPFARLAAQYRHGLGFEPEAVHVRSCEEHGAEAVAHVAFTGPAPTGPKYYKDAVTLRRSGDGWRVVLPANFGRAKKR